MHFKFTPECFLPGKQFTALTFVVIGLQGCVAPTALVVGESYGEPPPQVAYLGALDAKGNPYLTWERAWAFGPVPSQLQAVGDISCMRLDVTLRAAAYHPRALDLKGQVTPGGGYYCQLKLLDATENSQPPQAVIKDGVLGWDRPSAFGPITEDKRAKAEQECKKGNPKSTPLGFHPNPLDANGQTMAQGGYLCVE